MDGSQSFIREAEDAMSLPPSLSQRRAQSLGYIGDYHPSMGLIHGGVGSFADAKAIAAAQQQHAHSQQVCVCHLGTHLA